MALLEISGLYKRFGKTEVLKGIDITLEQGNVLAIIGSSGSGKTTLLRCMNLLESADRGVIRVAGRTIFDSNDPDTRKPEALHESQLLMGLVFQQFNLFPQYNVMENLTLAPRLLAKNPQNPKADIGDIDERARGLLEQVGLTEKAQSYPYELSGGQQQRVAIARALMLSPAILCFDEPTSALDPELTGEVLYVIRKLASKDMTMVIVTHEMSFAREVADRVAFMADGLIIEQGTPGEVLDDPSNERIRSFLGKLQK